MNEWLAGGWIDVCYSVACFSTFSIFSFPPWAVLPAWAVGWAVARLVRRIWGLLFSLPLLKVGVVCLMSDCEWE